MSKSFTTGEKVLVHQRLVAIPAVVVGFSGDEVTVAIAPQSNATEDIGSFRTWEQSVVPAARIRRYEW